MLAPKCGPLGMPPKKVGDDIKKATAAWKGIKIPVEIMVQNRQTTVTVLPAAASLVLRALNEPIRDRKNIKDIKHSGNLKLDQVKEVALEMEKAGKSMARTFGGSVSQILGTCASIGCTVEGEHPTSLQKKIKRGDLEVTR